MTRISQLGRWRYRRALLPLTDAVAWGCALPVAVALRYDLADSSPAWDGVVGLCVVVVVTQLAIGAAFRLYQGRFRLGSLDEILTLFRIALAVTGVAFLADLVASPMVRAIPLGSLVVALFVAMAVMGGARVTVRLIREGARRPQSARPTLVFGAGEAGSQLVRSMLLDPSSQFIPVALLDDDKGKRHLRINGVPVRGDREALPRLAKSVGAELLVIAAPSGDAALHRRLYDLAQGCGLKVKVVPGMAQMLRDEIGLRDLRDLDVTDVLGRRTVDLDPDSVAHILRNRRVLITGAGGSIGSELCRQVHRFGPSQLIMLDRDESALHAVELSIHGRALMESPDLVLCDIREGSVVQAHFERLKPEVVFHAAALKHLPMLEQYPEEGWKTNVLGTANVLQASAAVGVKTFVNISTDKAANPSSVLGLSKRTAEGVTAGYAETAPGDYVSVRFGNVLGSRGSVLESFAHQIAAGGPVTVTDPDVTRYFMTIPEASQLVIQAAALGYNCDALVLDMGEPVRIMDVAQQMIAMSGRNDIEIKITGLRSAEKLHEDLMDSSEEQEPTTHPLISRVKVDSIHLSPEDLVPDQIVARWMSNEYRTNAQGTDLPQL